jgi:hypothetical protein
MRRRAAMAREGAHFVDPKANTEAGRPKLAS